MTLPVGTRLGPYEILSPLGEGGMGEVYRARDRKLDRDVAIKVLPARLSDDAAALARFEREAKAVAALSHQNILAIHDYGTQDGVSYAVMELLEGETLRSRLDRGQVTSKQAVEYAVQIARGLGAAHERGIVHRDLKPENLFVARDGHVKILDFGLAKREERLGPDEETNVPTQTGHTEPGAVMGTVGYMSPEQVRGLAVDQRSDIFSFGTVLYEMLSGRRAFQKDTPVDTMSAILNEEPPERTGLRPPAPAALDRVVRHCLEKDRDRRFQSARDIEFALTEASGSSHAVVPAPRRNRPVLAVAALVVVTAAVGVFLVRQLRPVAPSGVKRIAVLPFENLGAPDDEYFADGMADEIRSKLTGVPGVEVIARSSSTPYKKTAKPLPQIARELGVNYFLTATVRWQKTSGAQRVHVIPELVEIREGAAPASRWQQTFDADLTDVFQVQADIAAKAAHSLGIVLEGGAEKQLRETPTGNLAAYDAFLRGEEIWRTNNGWSADKAEMIRFYERAVALDPGFARAWSRLSRCRTHLYEDAADSNLAEQARAAAEKALTLDPHSVESRLAKAEYLFWIRHDTTASLREFDEGQRLEPDNADLLTSRSYVESMSGHVAAAELHGRRAAELDPRSITGKISLADTLERNHRYSEERAVLDQALAIDPANAGVVVTKVRSYLREGNLERARACVTAGLQSIAAPSLFASLANLDDLAWVLNEEQRGVLLRLSAGEFESEQSWAICLAQASWLNHDAPNLRMYADRAERAFRKAADVNPEICENRVLLGLALAYLGRHEDAIREGERALRDLPAARVGERPYCDHQLVRIYTLTGESEKALSTLEPLLNGSYTLTPAWLKIDPNFDPLRSNPRFQRLVANSN